MHCNECNIMNTMQWMLDHLIKLSIAIADGRNLKTSSTGFLSFQLDSNKSLPIICLQNLKILYTGYRNWEKVDILLGKISFFPVSD